ncbi:TetR/AcrR family transcriptional regulator [Enterococcus faecalis]|nr:TetR/AcrR family transcriptional regulator [Enterococcus faecalis]
MARPKKNPMIKRKEFIDVAMSLFFKKGYDNTSIQDILFAVGDGKGLSPSVFYYYFKSKDELFEAMIREYMKEHTASIIRVLEDPNMSYQHKIHNVLETQRGAILNFKKIDTYFDKDSMRSKYFNYVIDTQGIASLVEPLEKLVQDGIQAGIIPETSLLNQAGAKLMVQIFLSSIIPLTHQGRENNGQHNSEKYLHLIPLIFSQLFNTSYLYEENTK